MTTPRDFFDPQNDPQPDAEDAPTTTGAPAPTGARPTEAQQPTPEPPSPIFTTSVGEEAHQAHGRIPEPTQPATRQPTPPPFPRHSSDPQIRIPRPDHSDPRIRTQQPPPPPTRRSGGHHGPPLPPPPATEPTEKTTVIPFYNPSPDDGPAPSRGWTPADSEADVAAPPQYNGPRYDEPSYSEPRYGEQRRSEPRYSEPADTGYTSSPSASYSREVEDLLVRRVRPAAAASGWRKLVSVLTIGLIKPGPSAKQEQREQTFDAIRAALSGVNKVAFVSAKGGVGKTTMTVAVGNQIASLRGDRVIAVDVNTDLGDLNSRFTENGGPSANIEHLSALRDAGRFSRVREFTIQNTDRLEALASQNDPRSTYNLNAADYAATMGILETHYNVVLLDCGTAITSPLFTTIAPDVTSLVVVSAQNTAGVRGARETLRWLRAHGFGRLLPRTVVVLNGTDRGKPLINLETAEAAFREEGVGDVILVPYDQHLAEGQAIELAAMRPKTRSALISVAGAVAKSYPVRGGRRHQFDEPGGR